MEELMDIQLGTRYYKVNEYGESSAHMVFELPFQSDSAMFDLNEVLRVSKQRLCDTIEQIDSIKRKENLTALLDLIDKNPESLKEKLRTETIHFYRPLPLFAPVEPEGIVKESMIPKPDSYYEPGTVVWVAISPHSHNLFSPAWRPAAYFILKTKIKSVRWFHWGVTSEIDSHYRIHDMNQIFTSLEDAKIGLCKIIEEQAPAKALPDNFQIFTSQDEKKAFAEHSSSLRDDSDYGLVK
jgi:hypothetical protein